MSNIRDYANESKKYVRRGELLSILEQFASKMDEELSKSLQASVIAYKSIDFILQLLERKGLITQEDIESLIKEMSEFKEEVNKEN